MGAASAGTTHLHGVHRVGAHTEPQGCIPGPYLGVQGEEAGGAGALVRRLEDGVAVLVVTGADRGGVEAAREVPLLLGERAGDLEFLVDDLGWGGHSGGQCLAPPPPPSTGCPSRHCARQEGAPAGTPLWGTLCWWHPTAMLAPQPATARVGSGAERGSGTWNSHAHDSPPGTLSLPLSPALSSFSRK